ncbi:MAG: hypothetical protein ABI539_06945 [Acidobacteriota bacterium]
MRRITDLVAGILIFSMIFSTAVMGQLARVPAADNSGPAALQLRYLIDLTPAAASINGETRSAEANKIAAVLSRSAIRNPVLIDEKGSEGGRRSWLPRRGWLRSRLLNASYKSTGISSFRQFEHRRNLPPSLIQ